ncbi:MAG: hypothetical protein SGJ11_12615 [Phycisphaerae bacterium]|nr:hypothetical protein [Phycisphaerae bacterium]
MNHDSTSAASLDPSTTPNLIARQLITRMDALECELASTRRTAERAARRSRVLALLVAMMGMGLLFAAVAPESFAVVRTKRLEIVDEQDRVVGLFAANAKGGQLDLWSTGGMNSARLSSSAHGGDLSIWNLEGRPALGAFASDGGGRYEVYDVGGRMNGRLAASRGGGSFVLQNTIGKPGVLLNAEARGGGIAACDALGRPLVELSVTDRGGLALIADNNGRMVGALRTTERGGALELVDAAGVPAFAAGADIGGGSFTVTGADGRPTMTGGAGANGGGILHVLNSKSTTAISLGTGDEGAGRMAVCTPDGHPMILAQGGSDSGGIGIVFAGKRMLTLEGNSGGGRVEIADGAGKSAAALGVDLAAKSGALSLRNENSQEIARINADEKGCGLVTVSNKSGTERRTLSIK